jgi:hypothetical protein
MKADGSDAAFDPIRRASGGKYPLRHQRQRDFKL